MVEEDRGSVAELNRLGGGIKWGWDKTPGLKAGVTEEQTFSLVNSESKYHKTQIFCVLEIFGMIRKSSSTDISNPGFQPGAFCPIPDFVPVPGLK